MKRLATAVAAIALIGTPAIAADMAVKAPSPAPAPVYNWTGWYVGGNVGASFGRVKTDFDAAPVTVVTTIGTFHTPGFAGPQQVEPAGIIGGGQVGYNWQFSPLIVMGIEADIQASGEKDSTNFTNNFSLPCTLCAVSGSSFTQYEAKIDWFGTVRGRIGYLFGDGAVLAYLTGGLAYGRVGVDGTNTVSGTVSTLGGSAPFSITHAIGHSHFNTGWTIGTGTEGKLLIPGWTYKIESLYVDLGRLNDTDAIFPVCDDVEVVAITRICSVTGGHVTTNTHFTDYIIRAGVNYQFH
jgi:outer membrane immunogenic protein